METQNDWKDSNLTSAFIALGMRSDGKAFDEAMSRLRDGGLVEVMAEVVAYVPVLERLVAEGLAAADDHSFPAPYDYEVAIPFGAWFRDQIGRQATGDYPSYLACEEELHGLVKAYFAHS